MARNFLSEIGYAMQSGISRVRGWPQGTKIKAGACLAGLAVLAGVLAMRHDPDSMESLSARKAEHAAQPAAYAPPPTRAAVKSFASGKVEEKHGEYKAAAESYAAAAKKGDKRGLVKLVAMTHARKCEARSEAADALADFRGKKATKALKKLAKAKFRDERNPGIFSCSSRRAAQRALEKQHNA